MADRPTAVGVLGGTFDPVHLGHLRVADEVRQRLRLSRMLLTPSAVPPHKPLGAPSSAAHRERMLRLALGGRAGLELCTIELRQERVCYTVDTLRALRDGTPPLSPLFVLGTDALLLIETWRDYRGLLQEFDLVVVERAGVELARAAGGLERAIADRIVLGPAGEVALAAQELGRGGRIFHLPVAPIAISSSSIRRCAAEGQSLNGLVPTAVAEYIERTGLYRRESPR